MSLHLPKSDPHRPLGPDTQPSGPILQAGAFKCLPVPAPEAVQAALEALGLRPLGEVQLIAEVTTRLIIPVVTVVAGAAGNSSTRYAPLLADDQTVAVRLLSKAMRFLREGWVPTHAQAHGQARRRQADPNLPLPHLRNTARIQSRCTAALAGTCRHEAPITVERARQLIRGGLAFRDDAECIQRICGECSRREVSTVARAQAQLQAAAAGASNPRGVFEAPEPPGLVALRAKLPDYTGPGLECLSVPESAVAEKSAKPALTSSPAARQKGTANWNEQVWRGQWSPEMAYALGVIAGDGAIQPKRVVIELDERDQDVLVAVCHAVGADPSRIHPVKRVNPGQSIALPLSSPVATPALLQRLGLSRPGHKDTAIDIPPGMPDIYLPDFLRGLVDTDGTVTRCGSNTAQMAIYSNSAKLIESLRQRVGHATGLPGLGFIWAPKNPGTGPGTSNHQWVVTGHQAKMLAHWIWPDHRTWIGGIRKARLAESLLKELTPSRKPKIKTLRLGGSQK
ncbi:LAGLIDADG family homing endonuclease [Holophaga foetida]|uniref:LAGLIDADG family homing endonuclease n=1 Tax=Holophaga foetida TaxID=35839 RepID=UPI00024749C8|nr:LAGLIDADG family homing endonuclease [Holophaga foetida]